jgi:hypothetical protein
MVPRLAESLLERERALQQDRDSHERFEWNVCQCCGKDTSKAECLCDGLEWYQLEPGGAVECAAHRFKRMIDGESRKRFWVFGRR